MDRPRREIVRCGSPSDTKKCTPDWPGWELFGTALYRINIGIVDARFVWFLAVGAIVVGHMLATWLAHETALMVFGTPKAARRSQGPMLVLMVGYIVQSLWILPQPIVEP